MTAPGTCVSCRGPLEADDRDGFCASCLLRSLLGDPGEEPAGLTSGDLGDYEILDEIARGGMGVVFRARSRRLKRVVALKLIHSGGALSEATRARFLFEAETAAGLDHPHIVPVYEFGESDARPWFSMKLIEGTSLEERIGEFAVPPGRSDPARCRRAAALMATVARAVHYAHDHGVLHRDLKPSNILVDRDDVPHVTDFGLAKRLDGGASATLPEAVLGTPAYMAPEVARSGSAGAEVRSDLYSLGAVLHHLLAGKPPITAGSTMEMIREVADSSRPSASRLGDQVDRDLAIIAAKCLEHSAPRRYGTALELAEDLERYLRHEPIAARAITPLEHVWHWCARRPVVSGLSAFLALAVFVGGGGILWQWRRAERLRMEAERNAATALVAERRSAENAYYALVSQALAAREQGNIGRASRLLESLDPARRGFEWRLLKWLCRGDDLRQSRLPGAEPLCLTWVPARSRLAVLASDRVLRWFNVADGSWEPAVSVPQAPAKHSDIALDQGFHQIAFSPDARHFLCADGDVLMILETATGRLLHSGAGRHMGGVWLDDRRVLYAGNIHWGAARGDPTILYDMVTGEALPMPPGRYGPLALAPDRRTLAWIDEGKTPPAVELRPVAGLLDRTAGGGPIRTLAFTKGMPGLLEFSPDGRYLAACSGENTGDAGEVRVMRLEDGLPIFRQAMEGHIRSIVFDREEPVVGLALDDAVVRTFRYQEAPGESPGYDDDTVPDLAQPVAAMGPTHSPARFLSRSANGGRFQFLLGHAERLHDIVSLPGPGRWASASADGSVRQWPLASSAPASRVAGVRTWNMWEHPTASPDGRFVLYRSESGRAWMWDRTTGRKLAYPEGHFPLAALRDGRSLTRHAEGGEIFAWSRPGGDFDTGSSALERQVELWRVRGIPSHPGFGQAICGAVSADERVLAALIPGKLLVVRLDQRTASGTDDQRMLYGLTGVNCMDLSPDGSRIAVTGFLGRRARIYRADKLDAEYVTLGERVDYDTAAAFHPDGRRLYVGNEDGWVRVFDMGTLAELAGESWRAQTGAVTAIAVSTDGRVLATSGDRTMRYWDAIPGPGSGGGRRERLTMHVPAARNWMRFADGDRVFLHVAPGHPLEAWEAP